MGGPEGRSSPHLVSVVVTAIWPKLSNSGGSSGGARHPDYQTGAGIPPEQLPDIFEAFRRGSNYAQRERQGAGLGLSIAKEIINRMGGEITAASSLGSGSTFTVTIPVETA